MRKGRFTEERVIAILGEQEAGPTSADRCHRSGTGSAASCAWKAKLGGLDVSEARRLKVLDDENAKLKRLLAGATPDTAVPKEVAARSW